MNTGTVSAVGVGEVPHPLSTVFVAVCVTVGPATVVVGPAVVTVAVMVTGGVGFTPAVSTGAHCENAGEWLDSGLLGTMRRVLSLHLTQVKPVAQTAVACWHVSDL